MLNQQNRVGQLTTPLGKDVLALVQFSGQEGLSELFEWEIEALSEEEDIDFDKILGKQCHIDMNVEYFGKRVFSGLCTSARWLGMRDSYYLYKLTLRPWLWLLGKTTDYRIFHDKTVINIIKKVFRLRGFSDYRLATTESYPVLHYTVQYRETDLNFVCRLMEQHGIYYYFEHVAGMHLLVLADARASHSPAPGLGDVVYSPLADESRKSRQPHLFDWHSVRDFRTGKFELNDYHHVTPNARMKANRTEPQNYAHGDLEVYEHPGPFLKQADGEHYVKVRLEAEQAGDHQRSASGLAVPLFPGSTFKFTRHPRGPENGQYLVTHITHSLRPQQYRTNADMDENPYKATFRLLKQTQNFRAPFVTEKPLIHSLHTALVTGQKGEEIDCDEHGRILVHFYWDRHNDKSCRVRVNQVWGAKGWGAQVIPRIGMEVMVAFIDGDPDRPIVIGSVPDPQNNTVPYKLPADKTKMVWRSNTHKGSGFNELSFEDDKGRQNFLLHAQKDFTGKVLNNHTHRVDNSMATSVGQHASTEVGGNATSETGGSQNNVVGATGPGVMAALGPLMGLMGQTSGVANQALGQAGGLGALMGPALGLVGQAAQALLSGGALGGGGRGGVVGGGTTAGDQGAGLAGAGTQLLQGVGQLFQGMPGVQNNVVTSMKTDTIGQVRTETVGTTKVTNIGQTFYTKVGDKYQLNVGNEVEIIVGKSLLIMKKDGTILLKGVKIYVEADNHIQHTSAMIDHN